MVEEKKTNFWCQFVVDHPKKAFCLTGSFHLSFCLLTGVLMLAGYDLFPTVFDDVPLDLATDSNYLRGEAWKNRNEDKDIINRDLSASLGTREGKFESIFLYYDSLSSGNNVFTKKHLIEIQRVEESIENLSNYNKYCRLTGKTCTKSTSIIRLFDGTFKLLNPIFNDPEFNNIPKVLLTAMKYPTTRGFLQFFLGKNSNITSEKAYSDITRTLLYVGYPLEGFNSINDRMNEQENLIKTYLTTDLRKRLGEIADSGVGNSEFLFESVSMYTEDLNRQVIYDLLLAAGSFMFIFCFMVFQTKSLFITSFAILSIITSFAGTNLIYRIVFDYKYFGIFHVLSVFIILGIGADDIFVFYDTWRATGYKEYPSLAHRLTDCYRKAAAAMLITSLTTMMAFIVNAASPLLAVQSFGLFSGVLVCINYLSVITLFPCVVILHHKNWASKSGITCSSYCCKKAKVEDTTSEKIGKKNVIIRFFSTYYFKFVTHKIFKWIILLLYVIVLTFFIVYSTKIQPDEEAVKIFKENTNYGKAKLRRLNAFYPSENDGIIRVYMIWGLEEQDRSNCHKTDFKKCKGKTVWDSGFDLNPAPAQLSLLNFCRYLKNLPEEELNKLKIRKSSRDNTLEIQCFIENMENLYMKISNLTNFQLPLTESKMKIFMSDRNSLYNVGALPSTFYRYFETGMEYWLQNGYKKPNYDYEIFAELLGHSSNGDDTLKIKSSNFYYGTRLRYAAIVANTSLPYGALGYQTGIPISDYWESFFKTQKKKMHPSLINGFQTTPEESNNMWHWFRVQKELANSAVQGILVGVSASFIILVFATKNVIMGFIATLIICCITVTVVGLIPLSGWKLGVLESLNLTLVVGLAVDYVVHLAEGYHSSVKKDRNGKVQDMLEDVAISVVSGALTTLGASLFMLFAKILFFMQFGIFMFGTIGFSLFYALGLFSTILSIVGPVNEIGSIEPLIRFLKSFITGRKKSDIDCSKCKGKGFLGIENKVTPENLDENYRENNLKTS